MEAAAPATATAAAPAEESSEEDISASAQAKLESLLDRIGEAKKAKEVLGCAEAWAAGMTEGDADTLAVVENLPEHLTKHATIVLKALYDGDILDDDAILAWHAKADQENDAVKAAQAFVDFLQED